MPDDGITVAQSPQSDNLPNKRACTQCRQQKVRCDVHLDLSQPCSRCKRSKVPCVIPEPVKRTSWRKRLYELDHASESGSDKPKRLDIPARTSQQLLRAVDMGTPEVPNNASSPSLARTLAPPCPTQLYLPSATNGIQVLNNQTMDRGSDAQQPPRSSSQEWSQQTTETRISPASRTIDGLRVEPRVIEEVFALFFRDYLPLLPILDPQTHPDTCYAQSPFLFWAIVATGSRRYTGDPTLFGCLSSKVINLAFSHLASRAPFVQAIQALLLLITWGSSEHLSNKDLTFPLSGLLVHMSMQIGLHNPLSSQDFAKTRIRLSDEEVRRRNELWAHCIILYQRSSFSTGQAPLAIPGLLQGYDRRQSFFATLPPNLSFQLSLHETVARANLALIENGLRFENVHQERAMGNLLKIFEDEISSLEVKALELLPIDKLYLGISRLMVQVMSLYQSALTVELVSRIRLYTTACNIIDLVNDLDRTSQLVPYATTYIYLGVLLSGATLLRILKTPAPSTIDIDYFRTTFFSAVTLLKRMSIENNDGPAKAAMVLSQLWSSDRVFHRADGTVDRQLRIRSRLAMSLVFDCLWWWREEFISSHENETADGDTQNPVSLTEVRSSSDPEKFLDEQLTFDLGWPMNDDFSLEALGWQSGVGGIGFPP